jgi:Spy/CpxP family protein refolding chaperone
MKPYALLLSVLSLALAGIAQHESHRDAAASSHHACLEQEREAIAQGEGFGMALVADRHGYPGPKHILELREPLGLTPEQEKQVTERYERMRAEAIKLGQAILEDESELNRLFAAGPVDPAAVRRALVMNSARRAELRWVHLSAHLDAYPLLTPEQRARYHELRYGTSPRAH